VPWRLIKFVFVFAVFLTFMVFNLDNTSGINLIFTEFDSVPVFLTAFSSFFLGMLFAIPVVYSAKKRKTDADGEGSAPAKKKGKKGKEAQAEPSSDSPPALPPSGGQDANM